MNRTRPRNQVHALGIRCAIYTRKSTEEGLEQEFNSLDAQRESGEAYVASQLHEGWTCLPDRYDDGGFTGGNMERPAVQRLMADIEAGKVDCVVVYKVDRLSRSLLDFARMMETFDKHHVSFVSVTQQFNTASSMGRLILNVLLSFAQFEREIISERTRDKIAAARRKGKWSGGMPLLGYDVGPTTKLVVNEDEAVRVRAIFGLYLEHRSLLPVVQELERRGWTNKRWTTRKGLERGGMPFTKTSLHRLLTNVVYVGKVRYKSEFHEGEQVALIDTGTWERVQSLLRHNGRTGGAKIRNRFGALLKGLIRCTPCGCAMTPSHTTRGGNKRYRYYVCTNAQNGGWQSCPSKSAPAAEIERVVVERIKGVGKDKAVLAEVLAQARDQVNAQSEGFNAESRGLMRDLARWGTEVRKLVGQIEPGDHGSPAVGRLADLQERTRLAELRLAEIRQTLATLESETLDEAEVAQALATFDPLWESLAPREQARVLQLLVEQVGYDGARGKVSITFHAAGIRTFANGSAWNPTEEH